MTATVNIGADNSVKASFEAGFQSGVDDVISRALELLQDAKEQGITLDATHLVAKLSREFPPQN